MSTISKPSNLVYEQPEQKILRYTRPENSIAINPASLLFAKYSFWQFENRIDIRKYFVLKHENPVYPDINAKLMPGKKGLCLTFAEALELVRGLRALLWVAKYCEDSEMTPSEEMIAAAMNMTTSSNGDSFQPKSTMKRTSSGSGLDSDCIYVDRTPKMSHTVAISEATLTAVETNGEKAT